jgi:CHAD domain-containing protein
MVRHLKSDRFTAVWRGWRALLEPSTAAPHAAQGPAAGVPAAALAGARVRACYRRIINAGRRIDDGSSPEELHELRKQGKELRYLLEEFGSLLPPAEVKTVTAAVKRLQDALGAFQDDAVHADELRALASELAQEPRSVAALLALGDVISRLRASSDAARAAFAKQFARLDARAVRAAIKALPTA